MNAYVLGGAPLAGRFGEHGNETPETAIQSPKAQCQVWHEPSQLGVAWIGFRIDSAGAAHCWILRIQLLGFAHGLAVD